MAKLTKRQRHAIDRALYHLNRARRYLADPTVAVCHRGNVATTTLHYSRPDGLTMYEVNKEYGSDLTGLEDCRKELEAVYFEGLELEPRVPKP